MPPLPSNLRRDLEHAIVAARTAAERGARAALDALTVPSAKAGSHLDAAGRALRNRLRAHARQLGDARNAKTGEQAIDRLTRAVAYEHWHRMLFARFLAENDLLIEPESGVSVSLDDVEELARDAGIDQWELASRYAQRMLPQIFRTDDPALAIDLPTEAQLKLESILEGLPPAVFTAADSLGWTYQFWQSAEKKAVNDRVKSGEKITGETLPAVTQLFTEHYMVQFLLHNTIGAWHAGKTLSDDQRASAESEQSLRDAVKLAPLGGYDFEYLRFVREANEDEDLNEGTGPWRPAAGTYDGWPREAKSLRVLDPCCGSGHFLVAAFSLLVRLRMEEESLTLEDSIRAVLADNLFGLELDARCTQIAAFNLAFAAWKLAGKPIDLPPLNIACSGLGPQSTKDEWLKMAERELEKEPSIAREPIRRGLVHMHELFEGAPELGSLIDPSELPAEGFAADFETIKPLLDRILAAESADDEAHERAVAARGMAAAAEILAGPPPLPSGEGRGEGSSDSGYTLVITNVPYLGRGSQSDGLKAFAEANYKEAKADLATIFVARILKWLGSGQDAGAIAAVTPQNWLFLTSYKKLRERLLKERSWEVVVRLGEHAFESIAAAGAFAAMLAISGIKAGKNHIMAGVDVSNHRGQPPIYAPAKAALLRGERGSGFQPLDGEAPRQDAAATLDTAEGIEPDTPPDDAGPADGSVRLVPQAEQLKNPDAVLTFSVLSRITLMSEYANAWQGVATSDYPRFGRGYWEVDLVDDGWVFQQSTVIATEPFGGRTDIIYWQDGYGAMTEVCQDGATFRGCAAWDKPGVVVSQMGPLPVTLFCGDKFDCNCSILSPFDPSVMPALWAYCASGEYAVAVRRINQKLNVTNATLAKVPFDLDHWQKVAAEKYPNGLPEPQSDDPTQWLFHGHPERAEAHAALQVGVARLVGYRWPAELDDGLRLSPEARALVKRCAELADHADEDGIVCLSPLRGEASAADRLRRLLAAAFGDEWSNNKERELLQAAADEFNKGAAAGSLDDWLRERFFVEHCKLFHHRPFVWHIWDGRKDGFSALVNYHKLAAPDGQGRKTLESLTYSYLGDWINRQEAGIKSGEAGAEARLAAAMELKIELEKILSSEPPYDLFIRWKPLHEQPIGWDPDINDGVRLNIRPFLKASDVKKKGAGVLRWKPNIKWTKDRGKEPQSLRPRDDFPWFWGWDEKTRDFTGGAKFDGNRWNDLHYTNAAKQSARERAAAEAS